MPLRKAPRADEPREDEGSGRAPLGRDELIAQFTDGTPKQKLAAIHELASAGEDAIKLLCAALADTSSDAVRDAAAIELASIGGQAVVDGVFPLLRSDDAAVRNIVIDILKELPNDVPRLMDALVEEPDADVRIFLVNALAGLRHPDVERWLIAVIDRDDNSNVVATALDALSEIATTTAEASLCKAIDRFPNEPFISFCAQNALKRLRSGA